MHCTVVCLSLSLIVVFFVVVAAIVANSAHANSDEILVNFAYALGIAQSACLYIAVFMDPSHPLFGYYFRLSIETAGFGWNTTATLVILKWLYNAGNPALSFVAWFVMVAIVIFLVFLMVYVQPLCLHTSPAVGKRLKTVTSEVRYYLPLR
jgi:hypothetical protein